MTKAEPQAVASQEASLPRWSSGDHVVFRQVWPGGVWAAIPATVIEDSSEQISVYVAPDTKFAGLNCTRQEYLRVAASGAWECLFYEWTGQQHVWASAPGDACSIWTMWSATDWTHLGWKVNPETPLKRTAIGFDTTDHVLDASVSADLSSWQWKDEEEFATAIEPGLFTVAEGERIRQETRRVVSQCVTSRRQQLQAWTVWRPPAGWTLPVLSNSWETA